VGESVFALVSGEVVVVAGDEGEEFWVGLLVGGRGGAEAVEVFDALLDVVGVVFDDLVEVGDAQHGVPSC
jgi:hypothetical protein